MPWTTLGSILCRLARVYCWYALPSRLPNLVRLNIESVSAERDGQDIQYIFGDLFPIEVILSSVTTLLYAFLNRRIVTLFPIFLNEVYEN